jgi:hypothetical protein
MVVGHKKLHDVSASRACAWWTAAAVLLPSKRVALWLVALLAVLLLFSNRVIAGYPAFHMPIDGAARLTVCRPFNTLFV